MADFHTGSRDNRHFLLRHASACGTEGQLRPAGVLRPGQHFINDAAPSGYVLARVGKKMGVHGRKDGKGAADMADVWGGTDRPLPLVRTWCKARDAP